MRHGSRRSWVTVGGAFEVRRPGSQPRAKFRPDSGRRADWPAPQLPTLSESLIHIILNSADGSFVERPFYGVQYIVVSPILLYARAICINLTIVSLRFIP